MIVFVYFRSIINEEKGMKMHTITLKVDNNIYQNVMFLLNNLKLDGLKIEDSCENMCNTKEKVKKLFKSKKAELFEEITDPMQWQRDIRDEW